MFQKVLQIKLVKLPVSTGVARIHGRLVIVNCADFMWCLLIEVQMETFEKKN